MESVGGCAFPAASRGHADTLTNLVSMSGSA
jgi:hypothetical protein